MRYPVKVPGSFKLPTLSALSKNRYSLRHYTLPDRRDDVESETSMIVLNADAPLLNLLS